MIIVFFLLQLFFGLQDAKQKGADAKAMSEFMQIQTIADNYYRENGKYEGFCNSDVFTTHKTRLEENKSGRMFSRDKFVTVCKDTFSDYAVSMNRYSNYSDSTYVCTSNVTDRFVGQMRPVEGVRCDL